MKLRPRAGCFQLKIERLYTDIDAIPARACARCRFEQHDNTINFDQAVLGVGYELFESGHLNSNVL